MPISMLIDQVIRPIVFLLPIWVLCRLISNKFVKNKKTSLKREGILLLFFMYIVSVLLVTIDPIYIISAVFFNGGRTAPAPSLSDINCVPVINTIKSMTENTPNDMKSFMMRFWVENILGNIVMFIPLGVFLPLLYDKFKSIKKTVIFAILMSISIETIQFFVRYIGEFRSSDIDDVILNTIGAFIGIAVFKKVTAAKIKKDVEFPT